MIHFFNLMFLTMPALSLSGMFGFSYFPNEKLVFLSVLLMFVLGRFKIKIFDLSFCIFISGIVLLITMLQGTSNIKIANINTVYFFIAIPFYIAYFKKFGFQLLKILPFIVLIQIISSFSQQFFIFKGYNDLALMFNNYPIQSGYNFPKTFGSFHRTSGFFNESSQYATFLVLYIVLYFEKKISRNKLTQAILLLSLIDMIINQSLTAYILLIVYICYILFFKKQRYLFKLGCIVMAPMIFIYFKDFFLHNFYKIEATLTMSYEHFPRLLKAVDKILYVSYNAPLTGFGLDWSNVSFDIISIYYYGFGLFGLLAVLTFIFYLFLSTGNIITLLFMLFILTNGNFLISLNIILIGFCFYIGLKANEVR